MFVKHDAIDVRVSKRILWVGSEAYPLHNIARANTLKLEPRRGVAIWGYIKSVVLWMILGGFAATILAMISGSNLIGVLVIIGVLGLIVVKTMRLIAFLNLTLYELVIETSGASRRALVTDNGEVVSELVFKITDAINNPHAEFLMRVENFHVGDNINQFGDHNVGKVAR